MKSVLISDLLNLRQSMKVMSSSIILFTAIAFLTESIMFFGATIAMLCIVLPLNLFSYDHSNGWDKLMLSLPISRSSVIGSKYIICVALTVGMLIFATLASFIYILLHPEENLLSQFSALLVCAACALALNAVLIPLVVKFGVENARYLLAGAFLIPFGIVVVLPKIFPQFSIEHIDFSNVNVFAISLLAVGIALIFMLLSFPISLRCYKKKQL